MMTSAIPGPARASAFALFSSSAGAGLAGGPSSPVSCSTTSGGTRYSW
ncbi:MULTISPECIES: hypothetical protein [Frankia]|nr:MULTISPECIES: hypothetical protein [Frankia]